MITIRSSVQTPHSFHIPVMGTGFTIDTPLQVAPYGISSVISLGDDHLIENMRQYHATQAGEIYEEIPSHSEDARARRITAYLNLIDHLVDKQVEQLRAAPFEPGSPITQYFEMLPESELRQRYHTLLTMPPSDAKNTEQEALRMQVTPGSIDVNIMTKVDAKPYKDGKPMASEYTAALAALRGYANSTLRSSVVFSAGLSPRLYSYINQFEDFFSDTNGEMKKKIILKVSDFRSALIQGKFLAKRGLWVSEFRVESGLNCGGHAFATQGYLLGPILDEFRDKKEEMFETLYTMYCEGLAKLNRPSPLDSKNYRIRITVQGGIGTPEEDSLLRKYYQVDATGWASPFLLVPDVVNIDDLHLKLLCQATEKDICLSDASPIGVPFWLLRPSASENNRQTQIDCGQPGSSCPIGGLKLYNTEFTKHPICTASRAYQKLKMENLEKDETLTSEQRSSLKESLLAKACLCRDLAASALLKHKIDPQATPTVCPGPNIVNFSRIASLREMVDHIYGRISLLSNPDRPHFFIRELSLYVEHLKKELDKYSLDLSHHPMKYFHEFKENLLDGIKNYSQLAEEIIEEKTANFLNDLMRLRDEIESLVPETVPVLKA